MRAVLLSLLLFGLLGPTAAASGPPPPPVTNYKAYFAARQEVVFSRYVRDVTGDGRPDYLFVTAGKGCGDCMQQTLYVFSGSAAVFARRGTDWAVRFEPGAHRRFVTRNPKYSPGDAQCCASRQLYREWAWNGKTFTVRRTWVAKK
jgi:hypothetical protein